ncbi:DNA-processing protein DprA [Phocoenobacter skyensis]|uniref:DNA processing protein n=1 Tax=Phocoenobacter skyensis TaxID=97481 RepID=A0A1H7UFD8_9PAST|nr:DNA-processing protein DprA [Pasteurella skyensis]MDP8184603.1 DNA-processing protein DprA [Pasteurella skyensis]QLB23578.1 DNA protecting protein DprA [Pasteurella skyensis]SEL94947.1 DNA processing protein [Pasteurella skyensis]
MNKIEQLLKLIQIPQLGAQRIGRLLNEVNFNEFCDYDKTQLRQIGWNEKQIQRWFHPDRKKIEEVLAWQEDDNNHLLTLFDETYPFLLRQISTAPPLLFFKGDQAVLSEPQIAIVGSRDYSHYGEYWAKHFSSELVKNNIVVTSGLAIGIDGFCHQQVVKEKGKTIAVLGSGLNKTYPARHKKLSEQILEQGGALVSEFFPNQPPLAENFPRRNRIISGLSLGTLVVEATIKSGSLITARYALEQGREVFAVPNSVQDPYAQGCHQLIKEGALLVDCVEDILNAIERQFQPTTKPVIQNTLFENSKVENFAKNDPNLTACQQQILSKLSLEPISADDLAEACEMSIETLLIELLTLELEGIVKQVSGGYVRDKR